MNKYFVIFACSLLIHCTSGNGNDNPTTYPKLVESETAQDETATPDETTMPNDKAMADQKPDIVELATSEVDLSMLVSALIKTEMVGVLKSPGPFTIFAPTNAAFAKLPKETLDALMADKDKLRAILTHHVVLGRMPASDIVDLSSATMLDGTSIEVDSSAGLMIGGAKVGKTDLEAQNGVIHMIDTVLLPE